MFVNCVCIQVRVLGSGVVLQPPCGRDERGDDHREAGHGGSVQLPQQRRVRHHLAGTDGEETAGILHL